MSAGDSRLSLLDRVARTLQQHSIRFAVIGAAAMAAIKVARSTQDIDLLTLDHACLAPTMWQRLQASGTTVDIRRADDADPLGGLVRLVDRTPLTEIVEVIIGRSTWQAGVIERATPRLIDGSTVPVVCSGDLVVLKLYAGGAQDAWDIEQLLAAGDRLALVRHVEMLLPQLPENSRQLWARIVGPR